MYMIAAIFNIKNKHGQDTGIKPYTISTTM